ncbi:abscisic acid 8'-hydroxylase 4 [Prosopis cineraria]|uniref:abscisic acid 8'-hydroxylase 4 n=1 Tax=Prosopis cineraria TaxID=364024 RepID=UPI0024100A99|nr:abscisic acid 8'-hydroxylase 4 [Prosopis cineraria]
MFGHLLVQEIPLMSWYCWGILLVVVVVTIICERVLNLIWYNKSDEATGIPPGNRGLPFVGETLHFMAAINSTQGVYQFVRSRRIRYGRCFKTRLFGETHVFMSSVESAKAILNNDIGKFSKRYIKSVAEQVGPRSLLSASQNNHKLLRAHLLSLFSSHSLASLVQHFDQLVLQAFNGWPRHGLIIIQHEALQITCRAMCKMLLSIESGDELETMQKEVGRVCEAMLSFPLSFKWTRFYKGLQARKRIMDILEKTMSERRSGQKCGRHQDFLERLLERNDNKFNNQEEEAIMRRLTDEEIRDNILTMIIAGQDTTANAITWMIKFLGENQQVLHDLMKEQLQVAKKCESSNLTLEDLNEMPFASAVVKEALRMASVVQWFPRVALEDCEIQGFKIKKGWNVNVDARSIHLDPTVYDDPDVFNPSRFHVKSKAHGFLPFGVGGRSCLGKNMAKAMMLVFLHRFITTFKWKVTDPDSSIEKWALFSKLRSGCPVHLTSIKDSNNAM